MDRAVKFADADETIIEGLLMPFGGPEELGGRDMEGEYFSPRTDFCLDWYKSGTRPLLYHHGLDPHVKTVAVGTIERIEVKDGLGGWMRAQIDKRNEYYEAIRALVKARQVGGSSGAMPHLVEVDRKTGEILRWPVVEGSLTPTECNPLARVDFGTLTKHYKSAGLELPAAVKAAAPKTGYNPDDNEFGATRADFAYIDADGRGHLPLHDAAHVRAAMARFTQTEGIPADKKKAVARKILAAARRFKIDVSDDSDVATAAKAFAFAALRAMMESGDSSGGFVAGDDNGTGDGAPDTEPDSDDHPAVVRHAHTHADGTRHSHPHMHDQGQGSHDSNAHGHPVPVPDAYKATKAMGGDYEGSYEDLRDDLAALLNPSGPFGASGYTSVVCTYPGYCIACRYDDGDEATYWKVDYTLGDDGEPALGAATQVEQTWVPVKALSAPGPLTLDAHDTARRAAALDARAKALIERRRQERRPPLSAANRTALDQTARGLAQAGTALRSYLDLSEELSRAEARADALASPEARLRELEILELEIAAYTA